MPPGMGCRLLDIPLHINDLKLPFLHTATLAHVPIEIWAPDGALPVTMCVYVETCSPPPTP
jgi:hypothetical protein